VNKAVFEQTTVKPEKFPYATTNRRGTTKTQAQLFPQLGRPSRLDPADWTERDLARMTPEAREDYERFILSERPKYIPMKPEKLAKLSPEDIRVLFKDNEKNTSTL
jgi:hypothetical protein